LIKGVSLGPGDPELITVRGLKILQGADRVYFPGSLFANGKKSSYSLSILDDYLLDPNRLKGFYLEMSLDREQAEAVYQETFLAIKKDHENGLMVAIVSEGDISTYSSFSYLLRRFKEQNIEVELIPGITSFALAASESQTPLCLLNEKVIVLPRVQNETELEEALNNCDTLILMKIRSVVPIITSVIKRKGLKFQYFERLGTEEQYQTEKVEELEERKVPYFSIMIIKKGHYVEN